MLKKAISNEQVVKLKTILIVEDNLRGITAAYIPVCIDL